ncbi:hypothetical protein ACIQOV_09820 [Kitasatospora sp. NPDC091257]|uniref:hypothetical protein n=1 Tax=unclassified Kitasatospora TaxID=2633591 RepID=UPI002F918E80
MTERQADNAPGTFVLPTDPADTTGLDAWLRPVGWCVEPDPAQVRPGYFRIRPAVTDPADHDGGITFCPGTTIQWTGTRMTRVHDPLPPQILPLIDQMLSASQING